MSEDRRVPFRLAMHLYHCILAYLHMKFSCPSTSSLGWQSTACNTGVSNPRLKLDNEWSVTQLISSFYITLVKLKLDPNIHDLAFWFHISKSAASRCFITWICYGLKKIPLKEQVAGTFPHAFMEKYPTTIAIIDASEMSCATVHFMEQLQTRITLSSF